MEEWKCRLDDEDLESYEMRICSTGRDLGLTWQQIADIINNETGFSFSETKYRRDFKYYCIGKPKQTMVKEDLSQNQELSQDARLAFMKQKLSDERTQINAIYRRMAREDTLKELGLQAAQIMNEKKILAENPDIIPVGDCSAIVQISDWHLGMDFENKFNVYNQDIAIQRISKLRNQIIRLCNINGVRDIYVVNLSDLIAGRIHLQIRLQSRIDVVDQTMLAAEILAEFLTDISSEGFNVHYYDCIDNHSRIEPNKKESMNLESFARFIPWYLKGRVGDKVEICDNEIGADIITFKCHGYNVVGVHGDKDSPDKVVERMSLLTHEHYDLALTAHLHHFGADEVNETLVLCNGTLMGTDDYAYDIRCRSKASQNLIIVNDDSVAYAVYRIVV